MSANVILQNIFNDDNASAKCVFMFDNSVEEDDWAKEEVTQR
jgi:hypothetical protein